MITGAADFVHQWARTAPWRVALRDAATGASRTYAELDARGWALARVLVGQGVKPGDRVALLARNSLETFEILVACLRTGAVFTPLNWRLAVAELADIVADCTPRLVLHDAVEAERAASLGPPTLSATGLEDALTRASATPGGPAHDPEALAMLLYTSGTTGRPKGVMVPHRQVFWNAINTVYACDLQAEDRVLAFLPLFHTGGINCLALPALYRGATVVLMGAFDAELALRTMAELRITTTVAVPTMYGMLLEAGLDRYDLTSVHTLPAAARPAPIRCWMRGSIGASAFGRASA
ncbi:MAG: AMP-binding protein [bacterium]